MIEQLEKIVSISNKLAPPSTLAIALACSFVIFMPTELAETLGVEKFRISQKGFLGWSLIFCVSYLISTLLWFLKDLLSTKVSKHIATKKYQRRLHDLSNDEKTLLKRFIDGENTIHCSDIDGVSGGLVAKEIIFSPTNQFDILEGVPFNIQSWARKYLETNSFLLELEENEAFKRNI